MNAEKSALQSALRDWQQRHHIVDNDPLLAAGELFQIHLESLPETPKPPTTEVPSFSEFRERLEQLDTLAKTFSRVGQDLIRETRRNASRQKARPGTGLFLSVFSAMLGFGGGVYCAPFLPFVS